MKKERKLNKVKFVCDNCGKESGYYPQPDSADYRKRHPFPYGNGWIFLYNLEIKVRETGVSSKIHDKEKHLCSKKCLLDRVKKALEVCDKIKNDTLSKGDGVKA